MDMKPITVRKNGKWYFGEAEMFRRNIVNILAVNMHRSEDGSYYIKIGDDINPLYVEDVPFYATGFVEQEDGSIKLVFFDLQEFVLEGELKLTLKGDVPYISYKWEADTRLSRGIYWKLSQYFDVRDDEVFIVVD